MLMGTALVPLENVWPTILTYSLAGGALVAVWAVCSPSAST